MNLGPRRYYIPLEQRMGVSKRPRDEMIQFYRVGGLSGKKNPPTCKRLEKRGNCWK